MNLKRIIERYKHSPKRNYTKFILIIPIILILISIAGLSTTITGMHSTNPEPLTPNDIRTDLYNQINTYRENNQLPILQKSIKLQTIAEEQSKETARTDNLTVTDYLKDYEERGLYCNFHAQNIYREDKLNTTYLDDPKLERIGIGVTVNKSVYTVINLCG